ncbi:cupin domain-containing protein [Halorussus halophilus]|uniref:cupin domain-containing protein n=1 Tax=Halorussus halophilus TaxID=2650975 RepID=UPI001300DD70|nr:cupin domain-containing protein [Halorussus halophilus]
MYAKTTLSELESRELDDAEADLRAVGYELRTQQMRPNVWEFETGEATNWHRQDEQEELHYVLAGEFVVAVGQDDDEESFEISEGDFLAVPPETWRQLEATESSTLLVVGAPNVKDDGIRADDE